MTALATQFRAHMYKATLLQGYKVSFAPFVICLSITFALRPLRMNLRECGARTQAPSRPSTTISKTAKGQDMAHTLAQWLQLSDALSRSAKYLRDVTYALATEPPNGQEQAPYDDLLRQFDADARSVPWRSAAAVVFGNTKNRQEREEDGAKGGSQPIILPFDANLSQLDAIEKARTSTVSICQGPPGTGKT